MSAFVLAVSTLVSVSAPAFAAVNPPAEPNTDGYYTWEVVSKTYDGLSYGSWKTLKSYTITKAKAPQDVSFSMSHTFSNTITGQVKVTYKQVEATVGFSKNGSTTLTVKATKKNAPAGTYYFKTRPVYKTWKVKQQRYFHIDGTKTKSGSPVYCYAKKFDYSEEKID